MAFPSGVPRYASPTGIWLAAAPPSSEIVDIEIWWKSTSSTGFSWLTTMQQSGRLGGPAYSFVHDLPLTTESHTYKARSVANGKNPSTFIGELTRRAVPLPQLAFGQQTPTEPVLGKEFRTRVTGLDCRPLNPSLVVGRWLNTALTLSSGTPSSGVDFGCSVALPPGARLTRMVARAHGGTTGASGNSRAEARVGITNDDGGYFVAGGTLSFATTAWETSTDVSIATGQISTAQSLALRVRMRSTGGAAKAEFAWADIYYTADSYTQLRT